VAECEKIVTHSLDKYRKLEEVCRKICFALVYNAFGVYNCCNSGSAKNEICLNFGKVQLQ
jgi:hypothetical protein